MSVYLLLRDHLPRTVRLGSRTKCAKKKKKGR